MEGSRVAYRYAKSLYELAEEHELVEEVKSDMELIALIASENRDFVLMLKNPIIKHDKKLSILKQILEDKVHELTVSIFTILTRKNRENILTSIASEFINIYYNKKGIQFAELTTAIQLKKNELGAFNNFVKDLTNKTPIIKEKISDELIGGFLLKIGDRQIDESISGKLKKLKYDLHKNI